MEKMSSWEEELRKSVRGQEPKQPSTNSTRSQLDPRMKLFALQSDPNRVGNVENMRCTGLQINHCQWCKIIEGSRRTWIRSATLDGKWLARCASVAGDAGSRGTMSSEDNIEIPWAERENCVGEGLHERAGNVLSPAGDLGEVDACPAELVD